MKIMFKRIILSILVFSFVGCTSSPNVRGTAVNENKNLSVLCDYLLFFEGIIYTVAGSKPMSDVQILSTSPFKGGDCGFDDDPYAQWPLWHEKLQTLDRMNFVWAKNLLFDPDIEEIEVYYTLVNKSNTMKVLFAYQKEFEEFTGMQFDPFAVVEELTDTERPEFWNVLKNHFMDNSRDVAKCRFIQGLLLGFGYENSKCFAFEFLDNPTEEEKPLVEDAKKRRQPFEKMAGNIWIGNFWIPGFVSYSELDPVVEKYEAERKMIQMMYEGKDLVDYTFELLQQG